MRLVDTHAHVNFAAFEPDREAVIARALEAGVSVVNVGTHLGTSRSAAELAERYQSGVYAVVGLHPVHTYSQHLDEEESHFQTREEIFDPSLYRPLAEHPKVVGIGECGLDYYRLPEGDERERATALQRAAFAAQVDLAQSLGKALVIHCRPTKDSQDAYEDVLRIMDERGTDALRFEAHSFTGSPDIAQAFVERGGFIGLNGIVTFDKTGNMAAVASRVPLERIVLETDCPYLTPAPHRGKRNEPAYVAYVARRLAELKGVDQEVVAVQTTRNASALFGIIGLDLEGG